MRSCTFCGKDKKIKDFYKVFNTTGICKECRKIKRIKYRAQERLYRSNITTTIREFIKWIKDIPCMDCSVRYPGYVMDFDHRDPVVKFKSVSEMSDGSYSYSRVWDEIVKCDVVCSNCHRMRTFKDK